MTDSVPPAMPAAPDFPRITSVWYQALVRAGRYMGATVISAVVVELPQLLGFFSIDPRLSGVIVLVLGGFLQGLGKALRGPSVDIPSGTVVYSGQADVPESSPTSGPLINKLPI